MALQGESEHFKNQSNSDSRVNTDHPLTIFFKKVRNGENLNQWFMFLMTLCIFSLLLPHISLIFIVVFVVSVFMFFDMDNLVAQMPMRLPIHASIPDGSMASAIHKKRTGANKDKFKAQGTTFMGVDTESKEQVWFSDDDLLTHVMILGTTKSGKTYLILQLMLQAMIKNSGFFYVDGKGDIVTLKFICQITRRFGRDSDLTILSFLPYERPKYGNTSKPSNTLNIMRTANATIIGETLISTLSGKDDVWKDRVISFINAILPPMVVARDLGLLEMSANKVLELSELKALEHFVWVVCEQSDNPQLRTSAHAISAYLINLPSYDKQKGLDKKDQESTTKDQHGYVTMQLLRALNDLSYNYGHIFGKESSDLDIQDAVFNRRNVVVSLPALGRSPSTLAMLGRIIISNIKQMASIALGTKVEGSIRLNVDARPTNARNIYGLLFDEVGYYMTVGIAIIPAQVRAFNIYSVFAGQTYSNIKKADVNEAEEIWNNTNIKLIGRYMGGEEGEDFKKVRGLAGESWVYRQSSMTRNVGEFNTTFVKNNNVEMRKEHRIELADLATQENGQFCAIMAKRSSLNNKDGEIALSYMQTMNPIPKGTTGYIFINEFIYINKEHLLIDNFKDSQERFSDLFKCDGGIHGYFDKIATDDKDSLIELLKETTLGGLLISFSNQYKQFGGGQIGSKRLAVFAVIYSHLLNKVAKISSPKQVLAGGQDTIGYGVLDDGAMGFDEVIKQGFDFVLAQKDFKEQSLDKSFDGDDKVAYINNRNQDYSPYDEKLATVEIEQVIKFSRLQNGQIIQKISNNFGQNIDLDHLKATDNDTAVLLNEINKQKDDQDMLYSDGL